MKKIILSLLIVFIALSLTGCGKKLTCESKLTEAKDGVDMTSKIVVTFSNDLSDKATIMYVFEDEETANTYYGYMKEASKDYKLSDKTITISKEIEDKDKINYEKTKTQFEAEGYTCK